MMENLDSNIKFTRKNYHNYDEINSSPSGVTNNFSQINLNALTPKFDKKGIEWHEILKKSQLEKIIYERYQKETKEKKGSD